MKKSMLFMLVIVAVFAALSTYAHAWVNPDLLMSPNDVEKVLSKPDWVILDCREKKQYEEEHIPGAIFLGSSCREALRDGTERAKKPEELEIIFGNAGIGNDKHVAVYGDVKHIVHAAVGFWILEYMGHDKVHFLDGGLTAWKDEGNPVTKEVKTLAPATFKAKIIPSRIATTEEILRLAKGDIKDIQLIDSRTEKEYSGYDIRSLRGGHIPHTTLNVSHELTYDRRTGKILPEKFLERFLGKLDKSKRTIALCQTGSRSTLIYLQMRLMGFKDPANYDESWVVYGNSIYPPYPVENEQWINLEGLVKLKEEIDKLKKEVEELKKIKQ